MFLPVHEVILVTKDDRKISIAFSDCETLEEIKDIIKDYLKHEKDINNFKEVIYRNSKTGLIIYKGNKILKELNLV